MKTNANQISLTRRTALGLAFGGALSLSGGMVSRAHAEGAETVQQIASHFGSIRSMAGDFVQFGPRGEQTGGKFYIQRPGKIRFNYDPPSNYRVIADGKSVVIENMKLRTSDLYPLSKTPLKLLLDDKIDLSGGRVKSVKQESDLTTIQLADKSVFGNSTITMKFNPQTSELLEWTITDAKGKDTTVMISNVRNGVQLDPSMFEINYQRNRELNQKKGQR
ncbi:MAG: outer membrane lipoprotein carrier protein LolA [Rhizobiaceae bacterium]|nr:outer membrane lipoprotein carrier protein LolA [Rhizobiaceae bacterium]